jgi:hypothetical protein
MWECHMSISATRGRSFTPHLRAETHMQLIPPVWLQSCLFLHDLHLAPHVLRVHAQSEIKCLLYFLEEKILHGSLIMPGLGCSGFVETSLKLRWIVITLGCTRIAKLRAILVEPCHFDSFYLIWRPDVRVLSCQLALQDPFAKRARPVWQGPQ